MQSTRTPWRAIHAAILMSASITIGSATASPVRTVGPDQCDVSAEVLDGYCDELLGPSPCFPMGPCDLPAGLEIHDPEIFDALFGTRTAVSLHGPSIALIPDADGIVLAVQVTFDGTCWILHPVGVWTPWLTVPAYGDEPVETIVGDLLTLVEYHYAEGVLETFGGGAAVQFVGAVARVAVTDLGTGETVVTDTVKPLWIPRPNTHVSPDRTHPITGEHVWTHPSALDCSDYCTISRFLDRNLPTLPISSIGRSASDEAPICSTATSACASGHASDAMRTSGTTWCGQVSPSAAWSCHKQAV